MGAVYGVALPAFTRAYDLDPGATSLILTTHATGGVLAVLAAVMGVRRLGARTSMALMAAGAGLIALTAGWPVTLLGSLTAGAGFGLIVTFVNRNFLIGFGPRGPGMVGLVNGISGVGLIAGPLFYVWAGGNIALIYTGIALFALCLIPLFSRDKGTTATAPTGRVRVDWRIGILILNFVSVCMEFALSGLGASALIALGWSENAAATLASGFFAAFLISRLSLYWLTQVFAADRLFLIGTIGTVATCALAAAGWQAVGYVISGAFIGLAFPSFFVWGTQVLGSDARLSAGMLLSGLSGAAVGPLVFGLVLAQIGLPYLFISVALLGVCLAVAILATLGPVRRAASQATPA